jgi:hypothetical protein
MGSQKQSGKAFEYAVLQALHSCIGKRGSAILESAATKVAFVDFEGLTKERQEGNMRAAANASSLLLKFEPHLVLARDRKCTVSIALQSDQAGAAGDVRDILLSVPELNWEIGISAKHQHEALKHSRLSNEIDFGKKWFRMPCSKEYFDAIRPIFERLNELRSLRRAWSQVENKASNVYTPLLLAFQKEVISLDRANPGVVAPALVSYLIGQKDFYKVMKLRKETKVQVYNFDGTLNCSAQNLHPEIRLEKLKLPTRIVELDFRRGESESSGTTLDMIL